MNGFKVIIDSDTTLHFPRVEYYNTRSGRLILKDGRRGSLVAKFEWDNIVGFHGSDDVIRTGNSNK